jgi:hypothetical protein
MWRRLSNNDIDIFIDFSVLHCEQYAGWRLHATGLCHDRLIAVG